MYARRVHDRGSIGLLAFFLALIGGAIVIWIVRLAGNPVLNKAANATASPAANATTDNFELVLTYLPAVFMFIGIFGIVIHAVYLRGIGE